MARGDETSEDFARGVLEDFNFGPKNIDPYDHGYTTQRNKARFYRSALRRLAHLVVNEAEEEKNDVKIH